MEVLYLHHFMGFFFFLLWLFTILCLCLTAVQKHLSPTLLKSEVQALQSRNGLTLCYKAFKALSSNSDCFSGQLQSTLERDEQLPKDSAAVFIYILHALDFFSQ